MDAILDCFFENFSQLERDNLHARYKRRDMVEYFNTLIEGCARGTNTSSQETCREAVRYIIRFHIKSMTNNGGVCMMGKYHNILYISLKLCYDWQLKDTETVIALLEEIYQCEKTFERLWVGALFGTRAPHFIAGWKSDFENQEENLRAVVFYLSHANEAALEFQVENQSELVRFIDIPIDCCGKATPLKILTQLGVPDKLHILLRFGAITTNRDNSESLLEILLERLDEFDHKYPYNLVDCLQFVLRAEVKIVLSQKGDNDDENSVIRKYPKLIEDGIVPLTRCDIIPVELKHLCRCLIREKLWQNYQLPTGIRKLPVPSNLHRYLDLLID